MRRRAAAAALALALTAGAAAAQGVTADPPLIARLLGQAGYRVELARDPVGDPLIRAERRGLSFQVLFYDCTRGLFCGSIQFSSGYDIEGRLEPASVNSWNRTQRWGTAYVDEEGDPFVQMDVNLTRPGVSPATFRNTLGTWEVVQEEFEDFIGW